MKNAQFVANMRQETILHVMKLAHFDSVFNYTSMEGEDPIIRAIDNFIDISKK
jgi:hypothetical protein